MPSDTPSDSSVLLATVSGWGGVGFFGETPIASAIANAPVLPTRISFKLLFIFASLCSPEKSLVLPPLN
jgi:hypothetical protein